jgi:hypothetical protein
MKNAMKNGARECCVKRVVSIFSMLVPRRLFLRYSGIIKALPKNSKRVIKRFGVAMALMCGVFLLHFIFYILIHVQESHRVLNFDRFVKRDIQIVNAPIVKKASAIRQKYFYYVDIEYQYELSGEFYKSKRVSFGNMSYASGAGFFNSKYVREMEGARDLILKGRIAYVDPKNPSYSILLPREVYAATHMKRDIWYAIDVGVICAAVAAWLTVLFLEIKENRLRLMGGRMNPYAQLLPVLAAFFVPAILVYLFVMVF